MPYQLHIHTPTAPTHTLPFADIAAAKRAMLEVAAQVPYRRIEGDYGMLDSVLRVYDGEDRMVCMVHLEEVGE